MGALIGAVIAIFLGLGAAVSSLALRQGGRPRRAKPNEDVAASTAFPPAKPSPTAPAKPPKHAAPAVARIAGVALIVAAVAATAAAIALAALQAAAPERLPARLTDGALPVVLALAAAVLWAAMLLWLVPRWQVAAWRGDRAVDPKEAFEVENTARATLGQMLGGIAVLAGLVVAWQQLGQTSQNLRVSEEGQITDRFTHAVDQLGDANLTVRLGGIYALERIARDSPRDYAASMEVLTAFARRPPEAALATPAATAAADAAGAPPEDVAAALRVIGRRTPDQVAQEAAAGLDCLHLERVRLPGADLRGYNLTHLCLTDADLTGAFLEGADLAGSDLTGASLGNANLDGADLHDAVLFGARFPGANLSRANLSDANLSQATLTGVSLAAADLSDAYLTDADLQGSLLLRTDLTRANLLGANLQMATISTDLSGAQNLTAAQLDAALLDRTSRLPAGVAATPDF